MVTFVNFLSLILLNHTLIVANTMRPTQLSTQRADCRADSHPQDKTEGKTDMMPDGVLSSVFELIVDFYDHCYTIWYHNKLLSCTAHQRCPSISVF